VCRDRYQYRLDFATRFSTGSRVLRLYQRAVIGLARGFGYVPTGPAWVHRLQSLHGDFRRSRWDRWMRTALAAMLAAWGAWQLVVHVQGYLLMRSRADVYLGALAFGILAVALVLLMRSDVWYRFEGGTVSAYRAAGTLLWQDDLKSLTHILCTRGGSRIVMWLHWPDHTRHMELYASLEAALSAPPT
jgi:hypothetical protein